MLAVDTWAPDAGQRIAALLAHEVEPAIVVMACLPESGDAARYPLLRPLLAARRIELVEVERAVGPDGTAVSSAAVRTELRRGEVAAATDLLGAPYTLSGDHPCLPPWEVASAHHITRRRMGPFTDLRQRAALGDGSAELLRSAPS